MENPHHRQFDSSRDADIKKPFHNSDILAFRISITGFFQKFNAQATVKPFQFRLLRNYDICNVIMPRSVFILMSFVL